MTEVHLEHMQANVREIAVPGYEDVRMCEDPATGLCAIVAIHSTTLGPALGGTRFWAYASDDDALTDVLRLSQGMTYKAAAAGLLLGGGKAVIIGDPRHMKNRDLLLAYGRFVETFSGRYITAADVGTSTTDLDAIAETTRHAVGLSPDRGGLGDPSGSTALGVFVSMKAAVRIAYDSTIDGLRVGVEGVGKVGSELIKLLCADGAQVVAAEPDQTTRARILAEFPEVEFVDNVRNQSLDVYSPCALGATVTAELAQTTQARVICGGANNQLSARDDVEQRLADRGIVWVPDFVANAGGLIQVAAERDGSSLQGARARIHDLGDSVTTIIGRALDDRITAGEAARWIAADHLAAAK
jgi:valine dehydrogenase (NAD+)